MHTSYADTPPKLVGGARGIDFLNTVEWRGDPAHAGERLTSFGELVHWCLGAGLLDEAAARGAFGAAKRNPKVAAQVLHAAIALREAAVAVVRSSLSDRAAVDRLNGCLDGARFEHRIESTNDGGLRSTVVPGGDAMELPLSRIIQEVVAVLTTNAARSIRSCKNDRCGWFFIDASRNSARRWCQMATCGNQAKARAHFARHRKAARTPLS